MKKVFSALVLTSLLAVLLVPTMASAATCPQCTTITSSCVCGTAVLDEEGGLYCYNGMVFTSRETCTDERDRDNGGVGDLTEAPTIITTAGGLVDLITRIGNWIFTIVLALAGIFLVVAGYHFVTASGNPEKIAKARDILINALIGVAIALGAKGLVLVIEGILRG